MVPFPGHPPTPLAPGATGGWGEAGEGCKQKGLGRRAASAPPPPRLGFVDKAFGAARTWALLAGLKPPGFRKEKCSKVAFFKNFLFVVK